VSDPTATRDRSASGVAAAVLLGTVGLLAVAPWLLTRADPRECLLSRSLQPPSWSAPFGFDLQGCDQLALTLYGARTSLGVTVAATVLTAVLAVLIGSVAGYAGGRVDSVLSRFTDVWSGIPLVLGGVVLLSGVEERGPVQLVLVLVLFGWPPMVRVLRASVAEEAAADHVTAARALGAGHLRVLRRHVLPGSVRPLLVFAGAYGGVVAAAEATLTFSGVGLARPTQSWGLQLYEAQTALTRAPHLLVPGLFVIAAVAGFVLLGEALRDGPRRAHAVQA
jgi:ABC-type dipeptide/oligopeptide/nickel transport system permease subunit